MKTAALVPLKRLALSKRRLRDVLPQSAVEELGQCMLSDVLQALRESSVAAIYTLTEDPAVARIARDAGSRVRLEQPDPGLNPAIDAAERELSEAGFEASLVVLGDLPLLVPADIEAVLTAGREHAVVIAPATDGGTAMLWRRPPGALPSCFGPDSAERHARAALEAGRRAHCLTTIDALTRTDLDTLEDARRVRDSSHPCRTRALLQRILP